MIDIEHGCLATLKQNGLALIEGAMEFQRGIRDEGSQPLRIAEQFTDDLVGMDGPTVVNLDEQVVLHLESTLDFLSQNPLVKDVLNSDAHAVDLVGIGWPNATTRRADLTLAQETLGDLVEGAVVQRNHVRVGRNLET